MDGAAALQGLGFELPSPMYILGAIVFGIVGIAAFRSGRKFGHPRTKWLGVALMLYPYGVGNTWALWAIGLALCAGIWFGRE
jgi:hypothetical protein